MPHVVPEIRPHRVASVLRYAVRRLGQLFIVMIVLSMLLFVWLRAIPGGLASSICGERCTPQKVAELRSVLGLDEPLIVQYGKFIGRVLQGDFGTSAKVIPGTPSLDVFLQRFPATIELAVGALLFALALGIPLGYLAARRKGGVFDNVGIITTLVGIAVPVFFLAYLLKFFFAVKLGWLPPSGRQDPTLRATRVTGFFVFDGLITREWDAAWDALKHLILPSIALGTIPLAVIFRITRSSVLEVQGEDYVRTAEAKGLSTAVIRRRHILRNAMLPVVTTVGLQTGALLAGAVLTETVFAYPGLGSALAQSFREKDYPVLQVVILAAAATYVLINLIVDLSYASSIHGSGPRERPDDRHLRRPAQAPDRRSRELRRVGRGLRGGRRLVAAGRLASGPHVAGVLGGRGHHRRVPAVGRVRRPAGHPGSRPPNCSAARSASPGTRWRRRSPASPGAATSSGVTCGPGWCSAAGRPCSSGWRQRCSG